jgi:plastocyanin
MLGRLVLGDGLLKRSLVVVAVSLATFVLLAPSLVVAATSAVTITESGGRYHFSPSTITIRAGDSVTWSNSTDAPHTVSADSSGPMHSSILNQGGSYRTTFNTAGTFAYHCEVHSYMHGTVRVEAAASHPTAAPRGGATPLPPSDTVSANPSTPLPRRSALLLLIGVVSFTTVLMFGPRLRRRSR